MFLLKKLVFKFMELGLGLRTCFSLDTKNPIFVNFKLSAEEASAVQAHLPAGIRLMKLKFCRSDASPEYWMSYNLYEIKYPKKELQAINKVRCEINTFVEDAEGRKGVYVFCDSPYVSKEQKPSVIGFICDLAERLVVFIYGCGKLIPLVYKLSDREVSIELNEGKNRLSLKHALSPPQQEESEQLSEDYWRFNDISFFNGARTYDMVNVSSSFYRAKFHCVEGSALSHFEIEGAFLQRAPEKVYFHRGEISYIVNSMNLSQART